MKYAILGQSGLIVSRLAFGAMTFGSGNNPSVYKVDQSGAQQLVDRALDAGINFFDTADGYADGQSEEMLGRLLGSRRKETVIATKGGFRVGPGLVQAGLSRKHLFEACEASLRRLNTDYIDLYIVHKTDPYTPLEETLEALNDLVRQGKIRYIGYSNWPAWQAAQAVSMQRERRWATFINGQLYYSLVGRDIEHETVPFAVRNKIGLTVWSPLAGGFLSGKYTKENLNDDQNRLSGFDFLPHDKEWGFKILDTVRVIAGVYGATPAQVSLAWLLAQPHISSVLVGSSKLAQLEDNLRAVELQLSTEDVTRLDEITRPVSLYPNWFTAMTNDSQIAEVLGY
ncbi:aryl-alcohol dehydrogenase-like predicted oxidoreductase [Paenibacillus sp. V4I3]|uniref:aldo/keto reductase n=1 Tax=unclassified Paenibacillus TaxID=185978 RepID=UPI0027868297|nr:MULTISPECIES: aldo/keto reductase [unclassified Paenibacillus]MDQ0877670.1 aryl-alcohol dehydrogenase-like predicted oxidoreductase [Paenibacillus sp. V4I3]MDQ0886454.1 aryl-alcohol dehydrogenase-like predicted oxidoreductase [Paenibacillus sp. V4I9]